MSQGSGIEPPSSEEYLCCWGPEGSANTLHLNWLEIHLSSLYLLRHAAAGSTMPRTKTLSQCRDGQDGCTLIGVFESKEDSRRRPEDAGPNEPNGEQVES